jgi:ankyrin repeat protein
MLLTYLPEEEALHVIDRVCETVDDTAVLDQTLMEFCGKNAPTPFVRRLLAHKRCEPTGDHLVQCCRYGSAELVALLLADPRITPSEKHNSALYHACVRGAVDIVKLLLADQRLVNVLDGAALRAAAREGYQDIVSVLLADGRFDPQEECALEEACRYERLEIVELLLASGKVDPAANNYAALKLAAVAEDERLLRRLSCEPAWLSAPLENLLCRAVEAEQLPVVRFLVEEQHANPACKENKPLVSACENWSIAIVAYLLKQTGVDPTARNNVIMERLVRGGFLREIELRLFHLLIDDGRVKVTKEMVKRAVKKDQLVLATQLLKTLKRRATEEAEDEDRKEKEPRFV